MHLVAELRGISLVCYGCAEEIKQNVLKHIISKKPWNIPRLLFCPYTVTVFLTS